MWNKLHLSEKVYLIGLAIGLAAGLLFTTFYGLWQARMGTN